MERLISLIWAAVFTALIICGAYISIPLSFSPVPLVLQNLFVLLSGLLLGAWWAGISVLLYLMLGMLGLPVFAGGGGGIAHFLGPTGGYLFGFLISAIVVGMLASLPARIVRPSHDAPLSVLPSKLLNRRHSKIRYSLPFDIVAVFAGLVSVYFFGVLWLMRVTNITLGAALGVGLAPFLFGDVIKSIFAIAIARFVRKRQFFAM